MALCKNIRALILLILYIWADPKYSHGLCVGVLNPACLENMEDDETMKLLNYVLSKYEEIEKKIVGTPRAVSGKRITYRHSEELHIVFQYVDNTPHDVLQDCVFILYRAPGQCESISTVCNTLLRSTPRPLLERKSLIVCEDVVQEASEEAEEVVTEEQQQPKPDVETQRVTRP